MFSSTEFSNVAQVSWLRISVTCYSLIARAWFSTHINFMILMWPLHTLCYTLGYKTGRWMHPIYPVAWALKSSLRSTEEDWMVFFSDYRHIWKTGPIVCVLTMKQAVCDKHAYLQQYTCSLTVNHYYWSRWHVADFIKVTVCRTSSYKKKKQTTKTQLLTW